MDTTASRIYINGIEQVTGTTSFPAGNTNAVTIGSDIVGRFRQMIAALPRIFNVALSASQINSIFKSERALFGV
jgi:hypothetical protein